MKILVSGAAGFIGSHLGEALAKDGHQVLGFDNFDPYYPREVKEKNLSFPQRFPNFSFVFADLRDTPAIEKLVVDFVPDAIIHLAAKAGVRPSILDPMGYFVTNVNGTIGLLEAARKVGTATFLLASSSSVYGSRQAVPFCEDDPVDFPVSPYAASKRACELGAYTYSSLYGMKISALRFFTVYGPRQRPDLAIASFVQKMSQGQPIPFFGDGSTQRDYTYIDDLIQGVQGALRWTAQAPAGTFEIFNLGESKTISLTDLVATLELVLGKKAILDKKPAQPGDVPRTYADIQKARRVLGYDPKVELQEGLTRYLESLN